MYNFHYLKVYYNWTLTVVIFRRVANCSIGFCWWPEVTPGLLEGAEPDAHQFNVTICLRVIKRRKTQNNIASTQKPGQTCMKEWGVDKLKTVCRSKRVSRWKTYARRAQGLSQTSGSGQTEEECIRLWNPFTFKYKYHRAWHRHKKSFIVTRCTTVNPQAWDERKMEKGEPFVINQEVSNTEA